MVLYSNDFTITANSEVVLEYYFSVYVMCVSQFLLYICAVMERMPPPHSRAEAASMAVLHAH